jgi:hypothetical protein
MLVLTLGVPTHVVRDRISISQERVAGIVEAWLSKQGYPLAEVREVGDLRFFPFLRVFGEMQTRVVPLAALPSPSVSRLAHALTDLEDTDEPVAGVDPSELEQSLAAAFAEPGTKRVQIEARGYYPVRFVFGGDTSLEATGVVGAGQGPVYVDTFPGRGGRYGGRMVDYLTGLGVLLAAEAIALPLLVSLWVALAAVVVTAAAFFGVAVSRGGLDV